MEKGETNTKVEMTYSSQSPCIELQKQQYTFSGDMVPKGCVVVPLQDLPIGRLYYPLRTSVAHDLHHVISERFRVSTIP